MDGLELSSARSYKKELWHDHMKYDYYFLLGEEFAHLSSISSCQWSLSKACKSVKLLNGKCEEFQNCLIECFAKRGGSCNIWSACMSRETRVGKITEEHSNYGADISTERNRRMLKR